MLCPTVAFPAQRCNDNVPARQDRCAARTPYQRQSAPSSSCPVRAICSIKKSRGFRREARTIAGHTVCIIRAACKLPVMPQLDSTTALFGLPSHAATNPTPHASCSICGAYTPASVNFASLQRGVVSKQLVKKSVIISPCCAILAPAARRICGITIYQLLQLHRGHHAPPKPRDAPRTISPAANTPSKLVIIVRQSIFNASASHLGPFWPNRLVKPDQTPML